MNTFLSTLTIAGASLPELLMAYRPFLDPLPLQRAWYLLLFPLCLGIAVTYKAVRVPDMRRYWRDVAIFTTQLVLSVVVVGGLMFWVVLWVLPRIVPMPA